VIVLDSSAVLAVILEEPGADRVKAAFSQGMISAASLAEILTKVVRRGLDLEGAYIRISGFGLDVRPVEAEHALLAAEIYSKAPPALDLSLGDRLCIALAMTMQCGLLTSDRGMAQYDAGIPIMKFR
jgi:PIN domain nuclease of toxin-antitoxin system